MINAVPLAPKFLEVFHEFVFRRVCRCDQLLQLFTGDKQRLQIGLARLWLGWNVDSNCRPVRDGDRSLRFRIIGQVFLELGDSDSDGLHINNLRLRTQ